MTGATAEPVRTDFLELAGPAPAADEPTVMAGAKENLLIQGADGTPQYWKAGQSRKLSLSYAELLLSQGAPIWLIS